jgi:hypothetical protein
MDNLETDINKNIDGYTTSLWVDATFNTSQQIFDYMVERMGDYTSAAVNDIVNGDTFKDNNGTMEMATAQIEEMRSQFRYAISDFAYTLLERAKRDLNLTPAQVVVFWYNIVLMQRRRHYFGNNEFVFGLLERKYNHLVQDGL